MHNFCLLNIKRPVLSFVFSLLLIVFGLYTFFELSTRELPKNLQPPEVVISTKYTGASPSIIASEISEPIELAIGGAEGIKSIDTLSEIGRSTIKIEFFTSIDIDDAANDIRERIARIIDNLPEDSKAPEVRKASAGFSTSMWLSVSSTSWNSLDIGDYTKRNTSSRAEKGKAWFLSRTKCFDKMLSIAKDVRGPLLRTPSGFRARTTVASSRNDGPLCRA